MINVTVWNENRHEQLYENIRAIYPKGIHGCIAEFLGEELDFLVHMATFDEREHGLTEEVLERTDVLIFWNHCLQNEFSDEVAKRVQKHVLRGMGLIALHSSHISKIMRNLLGTSMTLKWRDGDRERLFCTNPSHPIAKGLPEYFDIPQEEMYGEYFDIPKPDDVIFTGWFTSGFVFRSGCTFTRGLGKIFYFQPGHEEYPIYYQKEIQQIIKNAVRWCLAENRLREDLGCPKVEHTPEEIQSDAKISVFYDHIKEANEQSHIEIGVMMKQLANAGIKAMEANYFEVKEHKEAFREYEKSYGIGLSCLYANIDLGKNPKDEEARKVIDLAVELGCKKVLMIPGFLPDKEALELVDRKESKEETFRFMEQNAQIQNMKKGLAYLCEYAGAKGVAVTLEDYDDYHAPFATKYQLLWFMQNVPNLKFTLDMGNFAYSDENVVEAYELLQEYVIHVHCKDRGQEETKKQYQYNKGLKSIATGSGYLPIRELALDLLKKKYQGYFAIEHFNAPQQFLCTQESAAYLIQLHKNSLNAMNIK